MNIFTFVTKLKILILGYFWPVLPFDTDEMCWESHILTRYPAKSDLMLGSMCARVKIDSAMFESILMFLDVSFTICGFSLGCESKS